MGDDYQYNIFTQYTLSTIKDRAYFLHFNKKSDFMICYEFSISRDINDQYILKTNEVARLEYFESILDSNNLDIASFISMDLNDKINLLKNEGKIYYELFPNNKKDIEAIILNDFIDDVIKKTIKEYIEKKKDYLIRLDNNEILLDLDLISKDEQVRDILEVELHKKNIYSYGIIYPNTSLLYQFKEESFKVLPITTRKEFEDTFNDYDY